MNTASEWVRLGRPESYRSLPPHERRRLADADYLDGPRRRYPVVGPLDLRRAEEALRHVPPGTYMPGLVRLVSIARRRGVPLPYHLCSVPTPVEQSRDGAA